MEIREIENLITHLKQKITDIGRSLWHPRKRTTY